ncbi:unnamed protein product [Boreogadus saida]
MAWLHGGGNTATQFGLWRCRRIEQRSDYERERGYEEECSRPGPRAQRPPASPLGVHTIRRHSRLYVWDDACATCLAQLQAVLTEAPGPWRTPLLFALFVPRQHEKPDANNVGVGEAAHEFSYVGALQTIDADHIPSVRRRFGSCDGDSLEQRRQQRADETLALVRDWLGGGAAPQAGRRCRHEGA